MYEALIVGLYCLLLGIGGAIFEIFFRNKIDKICEKFPMFWE